MSYSGPYVDATALGGFTNLRYGQVYGENEDLDHLRGTGRSGLSPRYWPEDHEPQFPTQFALMDYGLERSYQRTMLHGFTSSTLHAIGALDKPDVKPPNLDNQIHPIFDRDHDMWVGIGTMPLDHGLPGTYTAHNDIIWNAMLPSLRLASKLVENAHCWAW
jgi:hypothetical protein